jgi:hypothetical protein
VNGSWGDDNNFGRFKLPRHTVTPWDTKRGVSLERERYLSPTSLAFYASCGRSPYLALLSDRSCSWSILQSSQNERAQVSVWQARRLGWAVSRMCYLPLSAHAYTQSGSSTHAKCQTPSFLDSPTRNNTKSKHRNRNQINLRQGDWYSKLRARRPRYRTTEESLQGAKRTMACTHCGLCMFLYYSGQFWSISHCFHGRRTGHQIFWNGSLERSWPSRGYNAAFILKSLIPHYKI